MIYDGINLNEISLDTLRDMEISDIQVKIHSLWLHKRLCTTDGREIIAEYNIRGDVIQVNNYLESYLTMLETTELNESFRSEIITRKCKLLKHRLFADIDDYAYKARLDSIAKARKTRNVDTIINTAINNYQTPESYDIRIRQSALHNARLCECFTN